MTKKKEQFVTIKTSVKTDLKNDIEKAIGHLQEIYQKCMSLQYSIDGLGDLGYTLGVQLREINGHRTKAEEILKNLIK